MRLYFTFHAFEVPIPTTIGTVKIPMAGGLRSMVGTRLELNFPILTPLAEMPCKMGHTISSAEQCAYRTTQDPRVTEMKQNTRSIALSCLSITAFWVLHIPLMAQQQVPMNYELYSWQNSADGWSFCLLYNTSSEKTVKQVFSKRTELRGVDQLKNRILKLPAGASITWVDRLPTGTGPKAKGSEGLKYPPADIMDDVRRLAKSHNVEIYPPSSPR